MRIELTQMSKVYLQDAKEYLFKGNKKRREKCVLNNINLKIEDGSKVGIIGSNGAGKTTLLNILSGYVKPTSGSVKVDGTISSVMEIGSSIDEMQTGRENIMIAGKLYYNNEEELKRKSEEIIDFIDIGDYIDQPLKIYSSGMKARISFGCMLFIKPEILIIDEVLGVGDAEFSKKSIEKTRELCEAGNILLMVSHSMGTIREFTERCIWLENGTIVADGPSDKITRQYEEFVKKNEQKSIRNEMLKKIGKERYENNAAIEKMEVYGKTSKDTFFLAMDPIRIEFDIKAFCDISQGAVQIEIFDTRDILILRDRLEEIKKDPICCRKGQHIRGDIQIEKLNINSGDYKIKLSLYESGVLQASNALAIQVSNKLYFYHTAIPEIIL